MTLPANLSMSPMADWRVWDNMEPIAVESPHRGANVVDSVPLAKRRALQKDERFPTSGVYEAVGCAWLIPVELAPQLDCQPGTVVIDSDQNRWTAQSGTALNTWKSWWRLPCLSLVLTYQLRDKIDIERADRSIDAAGAYVKRFPSGPAPNGGTVLYQDLPCRVQPTSEEIVDGRGIRGELATYHIVVDRQIVVDVAEDRVKFTDSTGATQYFDILHLQNSEQIGELPYLECQRRP